MRVGEMSPIQVKQYSLYTKQSAFHLMHSNISMNIIIWGVQISEDSDTD